MAKGIYKITNERTGEVYVGQTNNLYFREQQHMENLASGTHHNRRMQQDYNRGDRFSFEVLEYVNGSRNELHQREQAQIRNHNSFYAGYNQTPGGEYDKYKGSYQYGGGKKPIQFSTKNYSKNNSTSTNSDSSNDGAICIGLIFVFILAEILASIGGGTLGFILVMIFGVALVYQIAEDSNKK